MAKEKNTLSEIQLEILQEKANGYTNKGIATVLTAKRPPAISEGSVKTHLIYVHMWMGVSDGTKAVYHALKAGLIEGPAHRAPSTSLTPREHEATQLLVRGFSNKQIADAMGITAGTVRGYIGDAMAKYNAKNRIHLMALAYVDGVIT